MNAPFRKYHGTGNDFLIISADEPVSDRAELAIRECDRESGVGADGILFLGLEERAQPPRVDMTLFQPDGSTAPMCGNGARCAAEWGMDQADTERVLIETPAGTLRGKYTDTAEFDSSGESDDSSVDESNVAIEMTTPTFDPERIPVEADEPVIEEEIEGLEVTVVNTGVPHAVAFVDDVDDVALEEIAPAVRNADSFPRGTNVTIASPKPDGDGYRQRSYERGVEGETDACGTGAVAIAAAARRLGLTEDDEIDVQPPGGDLEIRFADGTTMLVGPVEREFDGEVSLETSAAE
ncbi:diaminopimelate epimerase [Halostagnicola sp. A-GB9-2]|uniref:diaminopimelate epimerase n=1 Tax=Halostagnicola sp. A-GB9-2 TaxID=3048066 RepID=UPI0024BF11D5|nr:diaminopimelate epimerase [Halostagnicola sp. A-GB9-2]MDJ1430871.1 diaminopimelate epimerase [Halostagnicola sp. A-GB9-2]